MLLCLFILGYIIACGRSNFAKCSDEKKTYLGVISVDKCAPMSADEEAVLALNEGRYQDAETLLVQLIADHPTEYFRYPRLATAYAAQAGFDIVNFGRSNDSTSSGSISDSISKFLPVATRDNRAEFAIYVDNMGLARDILLAMPEAERTKGNSFYGSSAELQLVIYRSSYSLMLLNKFTIPPADGIGKIISVINDIPREKIVEGKLRGSNYSFGLPI